jgi:hypothetical protein
MIKIVGYDNMDTSGRIEMPGDILSLKCPCGFQKKEIYVGVNDAYVHFTIFL